MRTPSEVYVPSSRRMPTLVLTTYPKHLYAHRVDVFGQIQHRRWRVYVTMTLAHYLVAVEEREEGKCLVWFCDLLLGSFVYRRERRLVPSKPLDLGQAPSSNPTDKGAGSVVSKALTRRVPKAV